MPDVDPRESSMPPPVPCLPRRSIPRLGVPHSLREKENEWASEQGVTPRSNPLAYISSLSSNRGTFSFWPAIEVTRPSFLFKLVIGTLLSRFHPSPRGIGGSGCPGHVASAVSRGGGLRDRGATLTHAVGDVARDSRLLEAIDPRNRSDSVTPVWGSSHDKSNRDKCR